MGGVQRRRTFWRRTLIAHAPPQPAAASRTRYTEALCRALVSYVALGGSVSVESARGEGHALRLTFEVRETDRFSAALEQRLRASGLMRGLEQELTESRNAAREAGRPQECPR